ncbi:Membrane protein [Candidatus Filomicrobium marinum]|uniref:Probable membrane transporter protein n=1 Tax=Candidatus Filomicrobium marinum TaxID=1608628 RepID=A0A0D6JDQ2_9HYPH|nr:sulfite exporter TauE/SafE family protein [Candidatus Filomicrobium marinum]CFX14545.1 Membrane protein [Candidatus Filomicrobium marinum]CPR17811.1 Membrane protein [Candidatus Filomicrobium marinum]
MAEFSTSLFSPIALTFFLAGLVKGVTGMGLPTVAMGILGAFMPPVAAASLLIVPSAVTNVWQLLMGPSFWALLNRLKFMMAGIVVGTVSGAFFIASGDMAVTSAALGAALVIYALYSLIARQLRVPDASEKWLSPLIGLTTGVVTGGTGVFVIPAVPYLQGLDLKRDDLVQALGLSFTVSTIALAIGLGLQGALQVSDLGMSTLTIAPALVGMWTGQLIRQRISAAAFRRWFLLGLVVLGTELMSRGLI